MARITKTAESKPPPKESTLERRFRITWGQVRGPALGQEFKFHPTRKWRADFVHHPSRTLIEVEGGIHGYGRHNRASGFIADTEKYLEANLLGWRVIRLVGEQLDADTLDRIARFLEKWEGESLMDLFGDE
jgi:very-short-patch-repair endonuclease